MSELSVTVQDLYEMTQRGQPYMLLDVREPDERHFCYIENSIHIPLGSLPLMCEDLPRDKLMVVYCHHGVRSLRACHFLFENGFRQLKNLKGGIDAWAKEIDNKVKVY